MNQYMHYSKRDLESIEKLITGNKHRRVYITGDMGSGKSHFCQEFILLNKYKFIELDKERDSNKGKTRSEVLQMVIDENINNAYILEHYRLLDDNYVIDTKNPNTLSIWKESADILILLHPQRQTPIHEFSDQKSRFDKLEGEIVYSNPATGVYVKQMNGDSEAVRHSVKKSCRDIF